MSDAVHLVVVGTPRTKKTSNRIAKIAPKHPGGKVRRKVLPSEAWEEWVGTAVFEPPLPGNVVFAHGGKPPKYPKGFQPPPRPTLLPDRPYNCAALFFRDARVGDSHGFYQGLGDLLEKRGVISNDKWLVSWDGSRLLKDNERPRVEIVFTPVDSDG